VTIKHVEFLQDPIPALIAPVTEIFTMTLKEGKTKEDLYEVLSNIGAKMAVDAPYPSALGEIREEPGKGYALVLGWNSSKVSLASCLIYLVLTFIFQEHYDLVGQDSYKAHIQTLFDTVDFKMFHAALKKHSAPGNV
jgi:hypothetical protein